MNDILRGFVLSEELFDYWEEQNYEFSEREMATIIYHSGKRWSEKKKALGLIADKTTDEILQSDIEKSLCSGNKPIVLQKRIPLENKDFFIPHPFRKGDIVKILCLNNEYAVVNNFKDDNEFFDSFKKEKQRDERDSLYKLDAEVSVEMLFDEGKEIAHYYISPLNVRHITENERRGCPKILDILSGIYKGNAYISDLLYVLGEQHSGEPSQ